MGYAVDRIRPGPREVSLALTWLHANFKPMAGTFSSIGLIEFAPVKELVTFVLAA